VLEERPGYLLKQAQHLLRLSMDKALSEVGLSTPQYAALNQLCDDTPMSNAELARRCFVTAQTMHAVVETLEQRKLIARVERGRGRRQRLRLTAKGARSLAAAEELVIEVEQRMFEGIDTQSLEVTVRTLRQVVDTVAAPA